MARRRALTALCALALTFASCRGPDPAAPVRPPAGVWHVAARGERAAGLAGLYGVPVADIDEINGLEAGAELAAGRRVFVPGARPRATKSSAAVADAGRGRAQPAAAAAVRMTWPVPGGKLSSGFGGRGARVHEGMDIRAPAGTPVVAAAEGQVIYAGSGVRGYGNMVIVRHAGGLVTVYAHNQRNLVQEGTKVSGGDVIAEVGSTGRTTGTHLHFEVRLGEAPQDPARYVKP